MRRLCVFLGLIVFAAGCVSTLHELTLTPDVAAVRGAQPSNLSAALLISPETASYQPGNKPDSIYSQGSAETYVIPLGKAVSDASRDAFAQMFPNLAVIDSMAQAGNYDVIIEPRISAFRYSIPLIAPFTAETVVQLHMDLKVYHSGGAVWQKRFDTPNVKGPVYGASVGKSQSGASLEQGTSDAVAMAARMMAEGVTGDAELRVALFGGASPSPPVATRTAAPPAPAAPQPVTRTASARFPSASLDVNFPASAQRPYDIAVVIGNADYGKYGKDIPNVVTAHADASAFKRYVTQALGVREGNVIDLRDASQADLISVFGTADNPHGQLYNWVQPDISHVTVYYAGHGAPAGADGSPYLVPVDANPSTIELNGYPLQVLYRNLSQVPAKSVTVVLEACFSGVAQGGAVISNASPVFMRAKSLQVPANITVVSAGSGNEMASWDQDVSHGLFTAYFLRGMSGEADAQSYGDGDGRVSWDELERYLQRTLTYLARRYYGREQHAQIVVGKSR